jgi:hypothetical protein
MHMSFTLPKLGSIATLQLNQDEQLLAQNALRAYYASEQARLNKKGAPTHVIHARLQFIRRLIATLQSSQHKPIKKKALKHHANRKLNNMDRRRTQKDR